MKLLNHIPGFLTNKYLIAIAVFGAIVLFFDKNDFFTQYERRKELHALEQSKIYYTTEVEKLNKIKQDIENDPNTIEKLSREQFLMKRDNEDLFIVEEKASGAN